MNCTYTYRLNSSNGSLLMEQTLTVMNVKVFCAFFVEPYYAFFRPSSSFPTTQDSNVKNSVCNRPKSRLFFPSWLIQQRFTIYGADITTFMNVEAFCVFFMEA